MKVARVFLKYCASLAAAPRILLSFLICTIAATQFIPVYVSAEVSFKTQHQNQKKSLDRSKALRSNPSTGISKDGNFESQEVDPTDPTDDDFIGFDKHHFFLLDIEFLAKSQFTCRQRDLTPDPALDTSRRLTIRHSLNSPPSLTEA